MRFRTVKNDSSRIAISSSMPPNMICLIFKSHKIFFSIIVRNIIPMMSSFFGFKMTANKLFYYKSMFKNITSIACKGMFGFINMNISVAHFVFATLPIRMIFSFRKFISSWGFFHSFFETTRIGFANPFTSFIPRDIAFREWFSYHLFTSKIRTALGYLKGNRYISNPTHRPFWTQKNLFLLDNMSIV